MSDSTTGLRIKDVTAFVLAGGQSRRMGQDKALLCLDGEYLIRRPIRALQALIADVRIVGNPERYQDLRLPVIPDCVESAGPLSGIYTALKNCPTSHALVVACDMPLIHAEFFRLLLQKPRDADAVVMRFDDGFLEPLCCLYSRRSLGAIEAALAMGQLKVSDFFECVNAVYVAEKELDDAGLSRKIFSNVNTQEEFQRLMEEATREQE